MLKWKSQVPEEFYIGSNPDEEIVCISKPQLQLLHDENLALSMQNLALTMVIQNGSHERVQPLKAPFEQVLKLSTDDITGYVASFKKTPILLPNRSMSKISFMRAIECQGDFFEDRRDCEATLINTYKIILTANYNSRSGSLNDGDKGVPLRPDARPKSHHDELPDHPGTTSDYPN